MKKIKKTGIRLLYFVLIVLLAFAWTEIEKRFFKKDDDSKKRNKTENTWVIDEGCNLDNSEDVLKPEESLDYKSFSYKDIPNYSGESFAVINSNKPFFTKEEIEEAKNGKAYEYYEPLDKLGRAKFGMACIDKSIMPKVGEKRGDISKVKPTGWEQHKYSFIKDGEWLYNRAHLLGYQLTGENDNERNLITGTRYFNASGMLPFENLLADYLKEESDKRKVLYRVTAIYKDDDLLARGVLMEALSLNDDDYDNVEYCVFVYNVQDGVNIDYKTGENNAEIIEEK